MGKTATGAGREVRREVSDGVRSWCGEAWAIGVETITTEPPQCRVEELGDMSDGEDARRDYEYEW